MIYDETFPVYAAHIRKITAGIAVIAAAAAAVCFGLSYGAGVVLGALFQIAFLSFLRAKYIKWSEAGGSPRISGTGSCSTRAPAFSSRSAPASL